MQLYKLLSDIEKKACKALDIRNVHINDLTIEELTQMGDILEIDERDHELSAIQSIREIYKRYNHAINKETAIHSKSSN